MNTKTLLIAATLPIFFYGCSTKPAAQISTYASFTNDVEVSREFTAPSLKAKLEQNFPAGGRPRNIILLIGDGMGQGALEPASLAAHGDTRRLAMQQPPVAGLSTTHSHSSPVTDSAAAATAIASGVKVDNGNIEVSHEGAVLKPFAERARDAGKSVGVITTDSPAGGTPTPLFARQINRKMTQEIIADAATSRFDILVGNSETRTLFTSNNVNGTVRNLQKEMEDSGYTFVTSPGAFFAVPACGKVVAQINPDALSSDETTLSKITASAIEKLASDEDGLLLVIESWLPGKRGHGNNAKGTILGVMQADWVAKTAVEFAGAKGDTLVICTADHETGALAAIMSVADGSVPVVHYDGPGSENFSGVPRALSPSTEHLWPAFCHSRRGKAVSRRVQADRRGCRRKETQNRGRAA